MLPPPNSLSQELISLNRIKTSVIRRLSKIANQYFFAGKKYENVYTNRLLPGPLLPSGCLCWAIFHHEKKTINNHAQLLPGFAKKLISLHKN